VRLINWFVATCLAVCVGLVISLAALGPANAASKKPNILIIWGDDIGGFSISVNNQGIMGYQDAQHRPHRQGRR
jgi:hypothetical protein